MPISKTTLEKHLVQVRRIEKSRIAGAERDIRRLYKSLLKSLNNYLAGEYAKGDITYADLERRIGYARFLEEVANKIDTIAPEVESLIEKTVKDTYTSCFDGMREAARKGNDSLLAIVNPVRVPEAVTRAINNPVSGLTLKLNLQKHRKEIIYNIQQNVGIGIINNDSYTSMAKRITRVVDGDYHKAVRIARTETHRVKEAALHDCAEEISGELQKTGNDLIYVKIWRTARDERVRPQRRYKTRAGWKTSKKKSDFDHQKMEGVTVRIDEDFDLGDGFTTKAPGQSGVAGHDINCRCELEYDLLTHEEFIEKGLIKEQANDIMHKSGGKSGALDPNSKEANDHAVLMYAEIRKRNTDIAKIANNVGWKESDIQKIKEHMFFNEISFADGTIGKFDPDIHQCQAWDRLTQGKYFECDILLLQHERLEKEIIDRTGCFYEEAHMYANKKYNWWKAISKEGE